MTEQPGRRLPGRRAPEQNVEVYRLGHWEQMQLGLALELAKAALQRGEMVTREPGFELIEQTGIDRWLDVFGTAGNVTIVKGLEG